MATSNGSTSVRLFHTALQQFHDGSYILRGVLDPKSLDNIQVGAYQREMLPLASLSSLVKAFGSGKVPDVELGMRGEDFSTRGESDGSDTVTLKDPTFVIDGYQRISAAKHYMMLPGSLHPPQLGAVVHLGTTEQWELERFRTLNTLRNKVSPNVLLRNARDRFAAVDVVHQLTTADKHFVMSGRVCWQNRMTREHLIGALLFCKAVGTLHARFGPGRSVNVDALAAGLQRIMDNVGRPSFRQNIITFFDLLEEAYKVTNVTFREGASYLKSSYLWALTDILGKNREFWEGSRLVVDKDWRRKIATFPYADPEVARLSGSSGPGREVLRHMMFKHINSGKRTRRLSEEEEALNAVE